MELSILNPFHSFTMDGRTKAAEWLETLFSIYISFKLFNRIMWKFINKYTNIDKLELIFQVVFTVWVCFTVMETDELTLTVRWLEIAT